MARRTLTISHAKARELSVTARLREDVDRADARLTAGTRFSAIVILCK